MERQTSCQEIQNSGTWYEIPPQQLYLLRERLRHVEGGREVHIMKANGRPHCRNALVADTIEAGVLDFVDQPVSPQLCDEAADAVGTAFSLSRIFGL